MSGDDMFKDAGLVLRHKVLFYGWNHGHLSWAPMFVKVAIVSVWNFLSCRIFVHDILDEQSLSDESARDGEGRLRNPKIVCVNCSKWFTRAEYEKYNKKEKVQKAIRARRERYLRSVPNSGQDGT